MMRIERPGFLLKGTCSLVILLMYAGSVLQAQVATRWRGIHGNGIYDETGLLPSWPESGPQILWSYESLGTGFSSPVVVNDRIYISGMEDTTGYVYALSNDGKLLWKSAYGTEFFDSYPGSRSTPVIAGDLLYQCSGKGLITCMETAGGKVRWRKDMVAAFGGRILQWGYTETFVVDGDKIYATPGGPDHAVVALNRFTGDLLWTTRALGELSAYCTPLLVKIPGRTLLVTHLDSHIIGVDAVSGKLLWTYPHPNQWSVHANTPIYHDGAVFCFSGYGQGGVKLKLSADGSAITREWATPTMDNRIGGAVLINGTLYGSGDKNRFWMALDWKTGEVKYQVPGLANGTVVYADGRLFGYTDRGELFMAKADPGGFDVTSKTRVTLGTAQHWAHPVIDRGRLLIRHGNALIAYKIK